MNWECFPVTCPAKIVSENATAQVEIPRVSFVPIHTVSTLVTRFIFSLYTVSIIVLVTIVGGRLLSSSINLSFRGIIISFMYIPQPTAAKRAAIVGFLIIQAIKYAAVSLVTRTIF